MISHLDEELISNMADHVMQDGHAIARCTGAKLSNGAYVIVTNATGQICLGDGLHRAAIQEPGIASHQQRQAWQSLADTIDAGVSLTVVEAAGQIQ